MVERGRFAGPGCLEQLARNLANGVTQRECDDDVVEGPGPVLTRCNSLGE